MAPTNPELSPERPEFTSWMNVGPNQGFFFLNIFTCCCPSIGCGILEHKDAEGYLARNIKT